MTSLQPQTTNIELKSLSIALLFMAFVIFIAFILLPISNWLILLVIPALIISITIIIWLDKLLTNSKMGWLPIATSILTLCLIIATYFCYKSPDAIEYSNVRQNGFYYSEITELTNEQLEAILQYDNNYGGSIKVLSTKPLQVKYSFASLNKYSFLAEGDWGSAPHYFTNISFRNSGLLAFFIIPIFCFLLRIASLKPQNQPSTVN